MLFRSEAWIAAAKTSPVYKMAMEWKVALPLHPEYRTMPMVWYVPPLSPIQSAANAGHVGAFGELPDVRSLRIPLKYLANLLTAGDEAPVAQRYPLASIWLVQRYKRGAGQASRCLR